jgi:hypothetical protein
MLIFPCGVFVPDLLPVRRSPILVYFPLLLRAGPNQDLDLAACVLANKSIKDSETQEN